MACSEEGDGDKKQKRTKINVVTQKPCYKKDLLVIIWYQLPFGRVFYFLKNVITTMSFY